MTQIIVSLIFKNGNTENRTHNAANELQGIATHDANGNMVVMPGLKGKYDAWNRLVEVRDTNDNLITQYEYNGLNQRIKKTVGTTVTKSFFNENWQEVESVTNNQVTSYVWGLRYIDDLVLRDKGEERLYSFADPNWNVVAISDVSGDIKERYIYDAFGKRNVFDENFTTKTGTDFNWNRAFTGQVLDSETGLVLYRERYYNIELSRFISRDPVGYKARDINIYRYVHNNSPNMLDPLGLKLCQINPPSPNGCGAAGGMQFPGDYGFFNFTPACNAHDICWGTCGNEKSQCDQEFRDNLYNSCSSFWYIQSMYIYCRNLAYTYYKAVKNFGQGAYDKAQSRNCKEIPDDECCPTPSPPPPPPPPPFYWDGTIPRF